MNRNFLLPAVVLGALVTLGALYSKLTAATPAPTAAPTASVQRPQRLRPVATTPPINAATNPEVARLDARRQLYESVDALVQASEFEKARKLLDEDQERYGDDLAPEWRDLEQSYRLMADCLEHPTPKLRVRAQAFALVSQASSLKPRILAACSSKLAAR